VRRGALQVAVATGGASPALSRAIREDLEGYFGDDYAVLVEVVAEVRRELRARGQAPGPEVWRKALDGDLRRLVAEGRREEAKAQLGWRLRAGPCG
jgi:precorrin-2 dehydrogenase/sirohydrochlorin ferrochelatase